MRIVQMTLDSITGTLAREGRLELRDFGVFKVRVRKAKEPVGVTSFDPFTSQALVGARTRVATCNAKTQYSDRLQDRTQSQDRGNGSGSGQAKGLLQGRHRDEAAGWWSGI